LVEEFRYAEVVAERPLVDFGRGSRVPGEGWSFVEETPAGTTFRWGLGLRSEVDVFLVWAREVEVRMRCRSHSVAGARPQIVTVLWDGEEAAKITFSRRFAEETLRLPAERATPGWHRLTFLPTWSASPVVRGAPSRDRRNLSIACDWIRFGGESAPEPARAEGDTLWIPVSSEVSFYLDAKPSSALTWRELSLRGSSRLEVLWEVEGDEPLSVPVTGREDSSIPLSLPWSGPRQVPGDDGDEWTLAPRPARLTLRATWDEASPKQAEAGVVLRSPFFTQSNGEGMETSGFTTEPLLTANGSLRSEAVVGLDGRSRPSIVLWIIDTLRADRLGLYGFERPVSPNYDALAARSTVFEAATAQSSWTRPTVATLLTGVGPIRHGVHTAEQGLGDEWSLLPELLRKLGYATAGFSANANVQRNTGFGRGFDEFWFSNRATAETLVDQALSWLDNVRAESAEQPFFVMLLSIEPHDGYEPAEPFRTRFAADVTDPSLGTVPFMKQLREARGSANSASVRELVPQLFRLYEAEIAWNDHVFGQFLEELERRHIRPAIAVVADHGEAFGEHGRFGHLDLHGEVSHIPFLVHLPGQKESSRVGLPVQQADVLPTLVDLAGGVVGAEVDGQSLLPLLAGADPNVSVGYSRLRSRALLSVSFLEGPDLFPTYSLVRGRWKLIEWKRPRQESIVGLFDRVNDAEELDDLARERPILKKRLLRLLHEQVEIAESGAVDSTDVTLDAETRRELEAMGYLE